MLNSPNCSMKYIIDLVAFLELAVLSIWQRYATSNLLFSGNNFVIANT